MSLTLEDYLEHWKVNYGHIHVEDSELTAQMRSDAATVVSRANALLERFGEDRPITSGWRPEAVNRAVPGAALRSNHTRCLAVDISDPDGDLDEWCVNHPLLLEDMGIWLEHPATTKGWSHWQIVPPRSGNRVFYP